MHEIATSIEFQMSLLLFVALGGYLLASRIGQPAVVGEILVGIIIGPSVLGWITYTNFVSSMAHLGAIILLFVTGLEFKHQGCHAMALWCDRYFRDHCALDSWICHCKGI